MDRKESTTSERDRDPCHSLERSNEKKCRKGFGALFVRYFTPKGTNCLETNNTLSWKVKKKLGKERKRMDLQKLNDTSHLTTEHETRHVNERNA